MRTTNIRHDLDAAAVAAQVAHKIASHEAHRVEAKRQAAMTLAAYEAAVANGNGQRWGSRIPEGDGFVDPMIDDWIARERDHYAKVRVIELPQDGKRFILVYGDEDDATVGSGTGPFESFAKAEDWFVTGGR